MQYYKGIHVLKRKKKKTFPYEIKTRLLNVQEKNQVALSSRMSLPELLDTKYKSGN